MEFKAKITGLLSGLKPVFTVATKGVQENYPSVGLVTLDAKKDALEAIADGGYVSSVNQINDLFYKLDYSVQREGSVTVVANDLRQVLLTFAPNEIVTISLREVKGSDGNSSGKELLIAMDSDSDQFQTLPVLETQCVYENPSMKKPSKLSIRRDLFNEYAGKIMFAHGFEEGYKKFLYWVLRSYGNNSFRFVAGSGQRFAVVEVEAAPGSIDGKAQTSILFPNQQTQTITGVLSDLVGTDIEIESHDRFIVISCDNLKMRLCNCDPSIEWPDENLFLKRPSKFCITSKISNWRNAIGGIMATYNSDAKKKSVIPTCVLSFDLSKRIMLAKSDTSLKSCRKISIDDIMTNESSNELVLKCNSNYVNEIVSKASDEDYIQIEVDTPSAPVIVRHYAGQNVGDPLTFKKPNEDGLSERYAVFFATVNN